MRVSTDSVFIRRKESHEFKDFGTKSQKKSNFTDHNQYSRILFFLQPFTFSFLAFAFAKMFNISGTTA